MRDLKAPLAVVMSFAVLAGCGSVHDTARDAMHDTPELPPHDANGDGIDVASAIFVDGVSGSDTNPGTMPLPRKTITAGIAAAVVTSPRKHVYVSKGIYPEMVTLNDGVSLYGL